MTPDILNKSEIAERFGVDVRSIELWVADGMPRRKISGRPAFSWHDCRKWREQRIRDDERATRHGDTSEERKTKVAEYRLRQLEMETENADLDLAERRGELVPLEFMRTEFDRIAQALRTGLIALPQTWALRLGEATSTVERQIILQDAINDLMPLLRELADSETDESSEIESAEVDSPEASDTESPAVSA